MITIAYPYDVHVCTTCTVEQKNVSDLYIFVHRPNLTNLDRLRTLVDMFASSLATSIADSGHILAMLASASNLTPAARYAELFNGMTQVNTGKLYSISIL